MANLQERLAGLSPEKRAWVLKKLRESGKTSTTEGWDGPIAQQSRDQDMPLSFAQQRLWFLYQLQGPSATYNNSETWRLEGPLNIAALTHSLTCLVNRHESLRTTFSATQGEPAQVIHAVSRVTLPVVDLQTTPEAEQATEIQRCIAEASSDVFDLEKGPLLRLKLLQTAPDRHYLVLTIHHIVSDGWSIGVITQELSELYQAFVQGQPDTRPPLAIQYADFALWQRSWLQAEGRSRLFDYWKNQLAGAPPFLELPTDHPRPAVQTFRGATYKFALPKSLTEDLESLARRSETTLFMVLQATFAVLLHRYTSQDDILVGTPIANRTRAELEPLIGIFVNTLVLRFNLADNPIFSEFLNQVRQVALDAYTYQDMPLEQLVECLQLERTLSHNPLFQVAFVLENMPHAPLTLTGLKTSPLQEVAMPVAKFDLTLSILMSEQGTLSFWEYSTDLFEEASVQRMARHFQTLLEGIVADPERPIEKISLLSSAERHLVLEHWNDTQTDYPQATCLHQLFEAQVAQTPHAIAVIFDQQLTYAALNAQANQVAHYLVRAGVTPGMRVGLYLERSTALVVSLLATLKAGAAYMPIDLSYPQERLAFMFQDAELPFLLTETALLDHLPQGQTEMICIDAQWPSICQEPQANLSLPSEPCSAENLAYVMYTSGSTGRPKGIGVPHRAVTRLVVNTNYISIEPSDRVAHLSNVAFDAATFEVWGALLNGAKLVILNREVVLHPDALAQAIEDRGITTMFVTTALFNQLVREKPDVFASLKQVLFGGEAVNPHSVRTILNGKPPQRLLHVYGPTESTTFASWYAIDTVPENTTTIPIGKPVSNTQVYILDTQLQPVPVGVPGELYIGGAGLAHGYWNRPELTSETFIPNPFCNDPTGRLYKTGDQVRYRPSGDIEFLGRFDHQVKLRGFRIELEEIEAILNQHLSIRETVVVARDLPPGDKHLIAYIIASEPIETDSLRTYLAKTLPDYMIPSTWVQLDAMPLTPNGKIDQAALPTPTPRVGLEAADGMPQTEAERQIAAIWKAVLQLETVGIHDNFFELGGHSLLITQTHSRLREQGAGNITITDLFRYPTIHALARHLSLQPYDRREAQPDDPHQDPDRATRRRAQSAQTRQQRQLRQQLRSEREGDRRQT